MIQDIKTGSLNYPYTSTDLLNGCKVIYGGVAWPGKRPGFAVIVAMAWEKHFDSHDIYLLEEYESFDTRELVRQCGVMDARYKPAMWIGDNRNDAADRLIREIADELQSPATSTVLRRSFYVCPTLMTEMSQLYAYILPHLKRLLDPERRVLFLKDSKVLSYLASIEETEVADLEFGEHPAIEALASEKPIHLDRDRDAESNLADSYAVREVL
jgi:hypothetical protein